MVLRLIGDVCLGLGLRSVNMWVIHLSSLMSFVEHLLWHKALTWMLWKKKFLQWVFGNLTLWGSQKSSGPTFLMLSRTPFWRILVIWSLNSNLEHPGVGRSLPWKSIYFHRALIVQGFPVFWVQLISLSLGEAVQDGKMVASVLPKAASSGYMIPAPKAFLQGCLHIFAVILGTQSYLSLLASTGLDPERGESIAWPNARGF